MADKHPMKEGEKMDFACIISSGEGQTTEFKKSLGLVREAMEALCSMVNADAAQGTVIFGIDPNGEVCGVPLEDLDEAQLSLSQRIEISFVPPLPTEITVDVLDGKHLILMTARRPKNVSFHEFDGGVWIRQGSENSLLTPAEKDLLRRVRDRASHEGPWICDRCGNYARQLDTVSAPGGGMENYYDCGCGGKFWPGK
jgi:predicted HTH transcriptional regulator